MPLPKKQIESQIPTGPLVKTWGVQEVESSSFTYRSTPTFQRYPRNFSRGFHLQQLTMTQRIVRMLFLCFFQLTTLPMAMTFSNEKFQFLYPAGGNSSSIEVNYLDTINVSWISPNTSAVNDSMVSTLSIDCWATNATNIATCTEAYFAWVWYGLTRTG